MKRGLQWIQHFNEHMKSRTKGRFWFIIMDGLEKDPATAVWNGRARVLFSVDEPRFLGVVNTIVKRTNHGDDSNPAD